jgi:REP element-mobilizing transposase RayT
MLRGTNKQLIFEDTEDHSKFLSCLSEVKKLSGFKLFAYCLMGNHIHLLIKEGNEPLSQIFRRLGARYAFWFNWKYERSGHLFQDRFRSEPIESDEYFLMVLMYIYQNPVKAGICSRPEKYQWCSRKLLGKNEMIDEAALFEMVPIETIIEKEGEEVRCDFLEPKIGRKMAIPDGEVLERMKALSSVKSVQGFQSLGREAQGETLARLRKQGASERQLARLSGLGRGIVARLCRSANGQTT